MPDQLNITSIPSNRIEFIDPRTGMVSREWYRFFLNLFTLAGSGSNQITLDELQIGPPPMESTGSGGGGGSGTVTSVGMSVPTGLSVAGSPITTSGTFAVAYASGYAIPTTAKQTEWDTAYTDRLKWDGGATDLVAATGRTSLGGTTVGQNFFTLPDPSAITFVQINADNTITTMDAPTFRTAIGAGTGAGSVTSVDTAGTVNGLTLTGGPITSSGTITLGGTLDLSSPPAIGSTTPAAGTFTTLTATGESLLGLNGSKNQTFRATAGTGAFPWVQTSHASGDARIRAAASSGAVPLSVSSLGSQAVRFYTNAFTDLQFQISNTASAVNYVQVTGGATNAGPIISVQGSDANAELQFRTKGLYNHVFQNGSGNANFIIDQTAGTSVVNRLQASGALTNFSPRLSAVGSDTNIDLTLTPKGTGNVRFGTLTASADAAITGYITIKDSGGTVRKLAVIA